MAVETKKVQKRKGQPPPNAAPRDRFDASRLQFHKTSSKNAKFELDDRFSSVLSDRSFQLQIVDKYGRTRKGLQNEIATEEFEGLYTAKDGKASTLSKRNGPKQEACRHDSIDDNEIAEDPATRIAYLTALSRGEVEFSSSSEDEDESTVAEGNGGSEDDGDPSMQAEIDTIGVLDPTYKAIEDMAVEFTTVESPYLALTNADWSHLRAVDIFAIVSSFVPLGMVLRVTVYPSDFGAERLRKEELFGPVDVWKSDNIDCVNVSSDYRNNDIHNDSVLDGTNEFDPEKLRLYEASRLKYFFAVVEFVSTRYADIAYKEIDGMEFEHSSAALDLRVIPVDELSNVIANRKMRDEATALPSCYKPPDFVVSALQQSTVQCTWDIGDQNREALLTKYSVSGQTWENIAENEDLKMYLGSDQSTDGDDSISGKKKSSNLRNMLGLDGDTDDGRSDVDSQNESSDDLAFDSENEYLKQTSFVPRKLRGTDVNSEVESERTPWEKYIEKRRQKRREKREAAREKRKQVNDERKGHPTMNKIECHDAFFVGHGNNSLNTDSNLFRSGLSAANLNHPNVMDNIDDEKRDFDMRGLERLEKNKLKQLKGARKRKEDRFAASVTGTAFQVNSFDERFKELLEGTDERFGIDRTDPNFKETPAMQRILEEQSQHRKKYRASLKKDLLTAGTVDAAEDVLSLKSGSSALNSLVARIKANTQE